MRRSMGDPVCAPTLPSAHTMLLQQHNELLTPSLLPGQAAPIKAVRATVVAAEEFGDDAASLPWGNGLRWAS